MHDKNAPGGCELFNHESISFPEQKDTTEEQGITILANTLKVGDEIKLTATGTTVVPWNDEDHDSPLL